jgi:hypothetical protein
MHLIYGFSMAAIGLFILVSAILRSNFVIYRWLVERSRLLWGDRVYWFHRVVGVILIVLGSLWACGMIWQT